MIFLSLFLLSTQGETAEIKKYKGVLGSRNYKRSKETTKKSKLGIKAASVLTFNSILEFPQAERIKIKAKITPRFFSILKKGKISPDFPGVNKNKKTISLIVRLKEGAERRSIEREGIKVRTKTGNIATVTIKLSELNRFVRNKDVVYIEPVKKLKLLNNILTGSSIALFGFSHLDTSGSEDNYTLSAKSGENLLIRACPGAYGLDPYLQLKDSSGNILAFDDNSGPGNSAEINWTFPSSGNYLIVVKSANPGGSSILVQDYQLLLSSTNTKINLFDVSGGELGNAFHLGTNAKIFSNGGKGVIVGIVDTGIDYKHEDFIDDTGKSRILYIWDQTDAGGPNPSYPYNYGSEWTKTQIDNEIDGTPAGIVREEDTNGHGTHVAGTAAGDGSATNGDELAGKYKGMAPEAELIIVKTDLTSCHIIDGVNYIFSKANSLGKPAVVNLSLGTHQSPHDGTGSLSHAMDESIKTGGSETKGRVVVVAAGNEGSDEIHAEANILPGSSETIKFFNNYNCLGMNAWHDGADEYRVSFFPPSNSTLQDWEWGMASSPGPTAGYGGIGKCWGTELDNTYQNNLTINLESPVIDLSLTVTPILTFKHWYKTESNWDGGVVKVSKDNGITWEKIYPEENGGDYPGYDVLDQEIYNASGYEVAKDGAYSGDSGWTEATFDLSDFVDETIIIKWTFHSDASTVHAGWYIDDVELKDGVAVILSEDFELDNGDFTTSINNSLIAEPGTNDWEWLGDGNGGVLYENYVLHDNYDDCNNDYELLIYNSCRNRATWQMGFQRIAAFGDGHLDAWIFGGAGRFSDHISFAKTVCEPGTANSVITVGACATKYMWDAIDGNTYYSPSTISNFGEIAYFSSLGPTRDGRMKPDIVAPGFSICSSLSSDIDFTDTDISVSYPGGVSPDDRHCLMAGTSMGSPAVAGATAFLLSAENKTASQIKVQLRLLAASSPDKFTPSAKIPNDTYGYGKLTLVVDGTESGLSGGGGGCVIATAAFGTRMAEEVRSLCEFRDQVLLKYPVGRNFIRFYYATSPPIAEFIRNKPILKAMLRVGLKPLVWFSKAVTNKD